MSLAIHRASIRKVCRPATRLKRHASGWRSSSVPEEEITFTSGGTEADNLAILGSVLARSIRPDIVTSQIEHPAVLGSCQALETQGFLHYSPTAQPAGMIDPDDLAHALTDDTLLVTLMHANNEVGTIQSIQACAALARSRGILVHTDAVQSVGKIPTRSMTSASISSHSLSGHKIHGPKGLERSMCRGTVSTPPTGGPQERGLRGGTEHVAAIVGLGVAAQLAAMHMSDEMPRSQPAARPSRASGSRPPSQTCW